MSNYIGPEFQLPPLAASLSERRAEALKTMKSWGQNFSTWLSHAWEGIVKGLKRAMRAIADWWKRLFAPRQAKKKRTNADYQRPRSTKRAEIYMRKMQSHSAQQAEAAAPVVFPKWTDCDVFPLFTGGIFSNAATRTPVSILDWKPTFSGGLYAR